LLGLKEGVKIVQKINTKKHFEKQVAVTTDGSAPALLTKDLPDRGAAGSN